MKKGFGYWIWKPYFIFFLQLMTLYKNITLISFNFFLKNDIMMKVLYLSCVKLIGGIYLEIRMQLNY